MNICDYRPVVIQSGEDVPLRFKVLNSFLNQTTDSLAPSVPLRRVLLNLLYSVFLKRVLTGKVTTRMSIQYSTYFSFLSIQNFTNTHPEVLLAYEDENYKHTLLLNSIYTLLNEFT